MIFVREVPDALSRVYMVVRSDRRNPDREFLVGEVHPKYLREIIENAMPAEGALTILDSTGGILYKSQSLPLEVIRRVGDELLRTHASQFEWNWEGETYLINSRSIFLKGAYLSKDWTVIVSQSKTEAFAPIRTFIRRFVLIIGLTVLVVLLLSIGQIRKNLSPLEKLRAGTDRISRGEFENHVEIQSGDEFEELALSFNTMSEKLGIQFRALSEANVRMEQEIAGRKRVEEQLLHSQKMEAVGQLTGGIAHDFNNLLTAINGYSGILLAQLGADDSIRKEIQGINDAGERAASLVSQLLTFSRKQIHQQKVVNLNGVVSDIDRMLRRMIGANVTIVCALEEELGSARIDPVLIEQVIVNLAVNARDAMQDGGTLTIETANRDVDYTPQSFPSGVRPGKYVTLRVSDTGCGMDDKTRSRIFEPFFTTKPPGKGTGLGLSTVYGIVQQSGGHILVESDVGKGTTFTVFLPRVEAPSGEQPISEKGMEGEDRRGEETLLIAEDEDLVRDLVRSILTARGYKVLEARDGRESIEIGNTYGGPIHLLVTDMVMPHMNGKELSGQLTKIRPGIKTLYMSGYMEKSGDGDEGPGFGAAFIRKPFRPEVLARKVREVLDG
jgi:signal transduction histidine kinase